MDTVKNNNAKEEKPETQRVVCDICGARYDKRNKARHLRTEKHKACKYIWTERFEITR